MYVGQFTSPVCFPFLKENITLRQLRDGRNGAVQHLDPCEHLHAGLDVAIIFTPGDYQAWNFENMSLMIHCGHLVQAHNQQGQHRWIWEGVRDNKVRKR